MRRHLMRPACQSNAMLSFSLQKEKCGDGGKYGGNTVISALRLCLKYESAFDLLFCDVFKANVWVPCLCYRRF